MAGSVASWEICAKPSREVTVTPTPTHDLSPIMARFQNNNLNAHIITQRHGSRRTLAEYKKLRKQKRNAEKNNIEGVARAEERFNMCSEKATMHPPQSYERQPRTLSYGTQQFFGPGMPVPEMDQQLAAGETMSRHPLSTESSPMRPQPPQQQYDYSLSGVDHSIYSVVPNTPIPSWPGESARCEPPQLSGPTRDHAHVPAQAAYDYERERQGQSWTPPPLHSSLSTPLFNTSSPSTQPQPLWEGGAEAEARREVNEEREC